jgi:DNA polymerase III sliding clamp (beta) subunit (PCNA family)
MIIKNDLMTITSRSEEGNVKEEIIVEKTGNDLEIGFNSKFVLDVLKVIDDELGELGIINDVQQTGSNDIYIIEYNNKPLCIPALVDVIKEVNINEGYMKIKLPKGLID